MPYLLGYLLIINASGLLLMLLDKKKARQRQWRIPERTLLGIAAIGGSIGVLLGMYLFRHKTLHLRFSVGVPLMMAAHFLLFFLLYEKLPG